ncbi:hypothetical protein ABT294_48375 [Nonomuraea sp. NPDC000554]|uniref:acyltransferase family protein n=1 Tax=Nonomuraea sp. NPDC000554 TaxID=3154259 RepID=UPI003333A18E
MVRSSCRTIAVGLLVLASVVPWRSHAVTYPWTGLAIAVLTLVILGRWTRDRTPSGRVLTLLAHLGTISYAAYLWNYPLTLWLRPWHPIAGPVLAVVLTVVCATLSWFLIERPAARRWGRSRPHRKDRKDGGLGASGTSRPTPSGVDGPSPWPPPAAPATTGPPTVPTMPTARQPAGTPPTYSTRGA